METKLYEVAGNPRRMAATKAGNLRDRGKEVKGPLEDKSIGELRELARARGLTGLSSARKSELLEALNG